MSDPIRVLIADDNKDYSRILSSSLSLHPDIEIAGVVKNGAEVIEKVQQLKPDAILLDLIMPLIDGFEVLEYLNQLQQDKPAVFILSAFNTEAAIRQTIKLGAVYYMLKPIETDVIVSRIRAVVNDN